MPKGEYNPENSILYKVDQITDEMLELKRIGQEPQYQHKEHCQNLTKAPRKFDGQALIKKIYKQVASNWNGATYHKPSKKNWRFDQRKNIDEENEDPEIMLERAIVNLPTNIPPNVVWANQVPTSSGFVNPRADGPRHIDLVHQCTDGSYEFIELKAESNNPLYAAMEILQYGVLYIFSRGNEQIRNASTEKKLLNAATIHLKVLAPRSYYDDYKLDWLEEKICNGLRAFLAERMPKLQMDFRFDAFPPWFSSDHAKAIRKDLSEEQADQIRKAVDNRRPVYSS